MKVNPEMRDFVTVVLRDAGVDVKALPLGACVQVRAASSTYMPFTVARLAENVYAVYHSYEQNGDLCYDPEVVFFTGYKDAAGCDWVWLPLEITHPVPFGRMVYAELNAAGTAVGRVNVRGQADLASFVRTWTRNLKHQGFAYGTVTVL